MFPWKLWLKTWIFWKIITHIKKVREGLSSNQKSTDLESKNWYFVIAPRVITPPGTSFLKNFQMKIRVWQIQTRCIFLTFCHLTKFSRANFNGFIEHGDRRHTNFYAKTTVGCRKLHKYKIWCLHFHCFWSSLFAFWTQCTSRAVHIWLSRSHRLHCVLVFIDRIPTRHSVSGILFSLFYFAIIFFWRQSMSLPIRQITIRIRDSHDWTRKCHKYYLKSVILAGKAALPGNPVLLVRALFQNPEYTCLDWVSTRVGKSDVLKYFW